MTGVQTCALPISNILSHERHSSRQIIFVTHGINDLKSLLASGDGGSSGAKLVHQYSESRLAVRNTFSWGHLEGMELAEEDELAVPPHVLAPSVNGDNSGPHLLGRRNADNLINVGSCQPTENELTRLCILLHNGIVLRQPLRSFLDVRRDFLITQCNDFPALKVLSFDVRSVYTKPPVQFTESQSFDAALLVRFRA